MRLSDFDFSIKHRAGKLNSNADMLSRLTDLPDVCTADVPTEEVQQFGEN